MDDRIKERVNIWLAKDKEGNLVNILEAEQSKDYYCLECGEILRARAKESEKVTPHFYHLNNGNCGGGINESEIHKYFKANLFHEGDTLITKNNIECKILHVETETSFVSEFIEIKDYRPDITLEVENKRTGNVFTICIELYYTNAKNKKEYIDRWEHFYKRGEFKGIYEIDLNQLEFDSGCKEAMEISEKLFPTRNYLITKKILGKCEEIKKCEDEIYSLENKRERARKQRKKELEDTDEDIEYRKSCCEEDYRREIEEINTECDLKIAEIEMERNLRTEEAKRKRNSRIEKIKKQIDKEAYKDIENKYGKPINGFKQEIKDLKWRILGLLIQHGKEKAKEKTKEEIKEELKVLGKSKEETEEVLKILDKILNRDN